MPRVSAIMAAALLLDAALWPLAGSAADLDTLEATRSRPLFATTRRPPPRPPAAAAAEIVAPTAAPVVEAAPPNLEVKGVIFGGERRVAILKRSQEANTTDVTVGSNIDGWLVADIQPRGIVLRRDDRQVLLHMQEPGR